MDTVSNPHNDSTVGEEKSPGTEEIVFGAEAIDPDLVRLWIFVVLLPFLGFLFWLVDSPASVEVGDNCPPLPSVVILSPSRFESVVNQGTSQEDDSSWLEISIAASWQELHPRKESFFQFVLPVAVIALAEIDQERQWLLNTLAGYPGSDLPAKISKLTAKSSSWLTDQDKIKLRNLAHKYRSRKPAELLRRIAGIPMSLILAQAAIESSWGESRFANEGNNLFGMWTWDEEGMIPLEREEGETHKVASYGSLLDSVRAYILTLNRHTAYEQFRKIRTKSFDSLVLADGLLNYSERREEYVNDVKTIISHNGLQVYD